MKKIEENLNLSEIYINFASLEPAKPLNDAQMSGSFFYTSMKSKIPYSKHYSDPTNLVQLLKSRGLAICDEIMAESYLRNIGYYRLSAYMFPFLKTPKQAHVYKDATEFNQVLRLYSFDKRLRILIFNEIEKIEIAVRSYIVNEGCNITKDPFCMTDPCNFINQNKFHHTLRLIDDELKKSKEEFILHFRRTYNDSYPPAWMLAEILPFGVLTRLYSNLKNKRIKKSIAQSFGMQPIPFESWLTIVTLTRNSCCHHVRIWNRQNTIRPTIPNKTGYTWISKEVNPLRIYFNLCIIKYLLNVISPQNDFTQKIIALLDAYPEIDLKAMGFPDNWVEELMWKN